MKNKRIQLLKSLIGIPSPSGYESNIAKFIKDELVNIIPKKQIEIDLHNNVIVTIKGKSKKKIMIDAHTDEVGFCVANIDKDGLLSLKHLGYTDLAVLSAKDLIILTNKGKINAVVDRRHSHLVGNEENEVIDDISEAQIDIGLRGRKTVLNKVKIGDPVIYRPSFNLLSEDKNQGLFVSGRGFDDKSGCLLMIETIKDIVKTKKIPLYDLVFVFSWGEEIGYKGAEECVDRYKPDLFIEIDVTFASDYIDDDLEREVGKCNLGKGIGIYRGTGLDMKAIKLLENIARKHRIKFQNQATDASLQYTSAHVSNRNGGTRALTIAIPLRNMHCPIEIINMKDINYGINLLKYFLLSEKLQGIFKKI